MRLKAKISVVSQIAVITVDSNDPGRVRADLMETAEKFPQKLNFKEPKKDEKIIIQFEKTE